MAERLDHFDFGPRAGTSQYPWDQWLDGTIWKLAEGVDFQGNRDYFNSLIYRRAKERGFKVRVSKKIDGALVVQAVRDA